jgi:hypothetical protein
MKLDRKPPFLLELVVVTPSQFARGLKDQDWFLREIAEKGTIVFQKRRTTEKNEPATGCPQSSLPLS